MCVCVCVMCDVFPLHYFQPESVGNFKIVHTVEDSGVSNVFNFHGRSRLKGGITTTVSLLHPHIAILDLGH